MSLLSLTFHTTESNAASFSAYTKDEMRSLINNLIQVEKYYFSEVKSEYINEGKNFNLLLIFEEEILRDEFIINELENITEILKNRFGDEVLIFKTELDPQYSRI